MSAHSPEHCRRNSAPIALAVCCVLLFAWGRVAAADAVPQTVSWGTIAATSLPEPLGKSLEGLLAASFESTAVVRVVADPAAADLALVITVKGKGPWQISAKGTAKSTEGSKPRKISARKVSFVDRGSLTQAVDTFVAELHSRWMAQAGATPSPLAVALSPSDEAVDSYLKALGALRSGDVPSARAGLDAALGRDPGFALAAAESAYLSIAEGKQPAALDALRSAGRARTAGSPLAVKAWGGLSALLDVEFLMSGRGTGVVTGGGATKWDAVLSGLSSIVREDTLAGATAAWARAVESDPSDPRALHFQGVALMAIGEFKQAADSFEKAIELWPASLGSRVLKAECHARIRQTDQARETLEAMKSWMAGAGMKPAGDTTNPDLMLGSVELLEGHYDAALGVFEKSLEALIAQGADTGTTGTLYRTIAQMRRDVLASADPLERDRQMEKARAALEHYENALTQEERSARSNEILMLRGLISARAGDTVEAWKTVEQMTDDPVLSGAPGFTREWLAGSIMLKEGDVSGAVGRFEKVASMEDRVEDWIVLGQLQIQTKEYDKAAASLQRAEKGLLTFRMPWPPTLEESELLLTDPYRAAMTPTYHYHRAHLAYLTGDAVLSRSHFNKMLGYYKQADRRVHGMVQEAWGRGAHPE